MTSHFPRSNAVHSDVTLRCAKASVGIFQAPA
jgi:hypothetical protein